MLQITLVRKIYLRSRFQSRSSWIISIDSSKHSSYVCFFDISQGCARNIFLQAQILLRFKVNNIENKMARGDFYEGTFYRAFSRCSHSATWILRRIFSSGSRRVGSKVPTFAHPHAILSHYSLCHDEREKERKRHGKKRERKREKEREREKLLNVERPLVATLRSDSAACIYPFVSHCVILERKEKRKRKRRKG